MYVAQEVNHVIGHVDEEQRNDGVELIIPGEHLQEVTLDELDSLVGPVVRHSRGGVARGGVGLMSPFGHEWLQGVLVQRVCVVC